MGMGHEADPEPTSDVNVSVCHVLPGIGPSLLRFLFERTYGSGVAVKTRSSRTPLQKPTRC